MKPYISKSAVAAEIERRLSLLENGTGNAEVLKRVEGVIKGYKSILSFLDTLEVKEVNEEPVSNDLEDEIDRYTEYLDPKDIKNAPFAHIEECARHFAKWQKEQMEKNRIENCDNITEKQYNLESDFVSNHIEKNNRIPTILDAIEYGMERQKQQLIDKACEWLNYQLNLPSDFEVHFRKAMEMEE